MSTAQKMRRNHAGYVHWEGPDNVLFMLFDGNKDYRPAEGWILKKKPENQSETMMRQVSRFGWNFNKLQQLKMMLSSFFWPPCG